MSISAASFIHDGIRCVPCVCLRFVVRRVKAPCTQSSTQTQHRLYIGTSHHQCMWPKALIQSDKANSPSVTQSHADGLCLHAEKTNLYTCSEQKIVFYWNAQIYFKVVHRQYTVEQQTVNISLRRHLYPVSPDRHVIYSNQSQDRRQILPLWHN